MTRGSIAGVSYAFPAASRTVAQLGAAGLLESEPELLRSFGFGSVHVAEGESPYELALDAARSLLEETGIDPEEVGLLVYCGAPGLAGFAPAAAPPPASFLRTMERFRFPGTRLQYDLGLGSATVIGVDQLACTGLFGAVRVARAICIAEEIERALCVSAEFFPADAGREAIFNCTSDAACAVVVERSGARNRILAASHVTKGYYWDAEALRDQVIASYFPTACHVIERTLRSAGWTADDVDWVVPHNVGIRSWEILLCLTGLSRARLWSRNIARDGHTLAGDNFINLKDGLSSGSIRPGDRVLLFSYGYGAHWTALAIEA
jgi:3-oxoacyl-[acyl-carrier-protein] synthase III